MPVPAQLWVSVKFKELPEIVRTKKDGWRLYSVDCGDGRIITFELRPRLFMKMETGVAAYERWTVVVGGKMGARHGNGFHIEEADVVAVMENKNKRPPKDAPATTSEVTPVAEGEASTTAPSGPPLLAAEATPRVSAEGEVPVQASAPVGPPKKVKTPKGPRVPEVYRVVRGASEGASVPEAREKNDADS